MTDSAPLAAQILWERVGADIMEDWKKQNQMRRTHQQKKQEEQSTHCGRRCLSENHVKRMLVQKKTGAVTVLVDVQKAFGKVQLTAV